MGMALAGVPDGGASPEASQARVDTASEALCATGVAAFARALTSALRPNIFADPNMAKNSANQNPLLLNAEAFSPPREVCGACSFL
jgi:hypothetical protein